VKKRSAKAGLPPGSLVHVGERKAEQVRISIIDFDQTEIREVQVGSVEESFPFRDTSSVTWINIDGLHDVGLIEKLGKHFGLHPLVLEDILNTNQRPKVEDFGEYVYVVVRMLSVEPNNGKIQSEQVSLIFSRKFVISFQEAVGDVFERVRTNLRHGRGSTRKMAADYLVYCLIDAIVDQYFAVLESFGERIEELERQVVGRPGGPVLRRIHETKRALLLLRRSVWPLREVVSALQRDSVPLVEASTTPYLRDLYGHVIEVIDTLEILREMTSGMLEIYLSSASNRLNEVMKTLTIIATIFMPLTFIVGVYGMNFDVMPELKWKWGYALVWGVMLAVSLGMLFYFWRRKWI
jgi:magnesium transporter